MFSGQQCCCYWQLDKWMLGSIKSELYKGTHTQRAGCSLLCVEENDNFYSFFRLIRWVWIIHTKAVTKAAPACGTTARSCWDGMISNWTSTATPPLKLYKTCLCCSITAQFKETRHCQKPLSQTESDYNLTHCSLWKAATGFFCKSAIEDKNSILIWLFSVLQKPLETIVWRSPLALGAGRWSSCADVLGTLGGGAAAGFSTFPPPPRLKENHALSISSCSMGNSTGGGTCTRAGWGGRNKCNADSDGEATLSLSSIPPLCSILEYGWAGKCWLSLVQPDDTLAGSSLNKGEGSP